MVKLGSGPGSPTPCRKQGKLQERHFLQGLIQTGFSLHLPSCSMHLELPSLGFLFFFSGAMTEGCSLDKVQPRCRMAAPEDWLCSEVTPTGIPPSSSLPKSSPFPPVLFLPKKSMNGTQQLLKWETSK